MATLIFNFQFSILNYQFHSNLNLKFQISNLNFNFQFQFSISILNSQFSIFTLNTNQQLTNQPIAEFRKKHTTPLYKFAD